MPVKPNLELHIDELILHGFAPADRYRIAEALQQELSRLFTAEGVPMTLNQGSAIAMLDGGEFAYTQDMNAQTIGVQVAHSIYGGLNQ